MPVSRLDGREGGRERQAVFFMGPTRMPQPPIFHDPVCRRVGIAYKYTLYVIRYLSYLLTSYVRSYVKVGRFLPNHRSTVV